MTNKQIRRQVDAFCEARQAWIDILVKSPNSVDAPMHILSINHKIDLLKSLWNWSDETVDFPY